MHRSMFMLLFLALPARADLVVRPVQGVDDPLRIQAEGHQVSAYQAFTAIAAHLGMTMHWSLKDQAELKDFFLTIEIPDRHARMVLELIGASVGKEVHLDSDLKAILVSAEASAQTRSGRRALRERAVRSYREALLDPAHRTDPLEIKGRLADLFMKEEDHVAAAKEWREIVENQGGRPTSGGLYPRACLGAGLALERAGKPADAREFFLKVIRDFRESEYLMQALLGNARSLYALGRIREGVESLERYLVNERYFKAYVGARNEAALRLALAEGKYLSKAYKQCVELLEPALEAAGLSVAERRAALLHAGLAGLRAGEPERAATWLGEYLLETPAEHREAEAWLGLSEALVACGRRVEALAALAELEPAGLPADQRRRHALALSAVELDLGRPGRAAIALERALGADGAGSDPALALALARARAEAGDLGQARRLYQALLEAPGRTPPGAGDEAVLDAARVGLVATLARQGYHEDAAAAARGLLPRAATEGGRRELFQALVEALVRAGRVEEAAREILR